MQTLHLGHHEQSQELSTRGIGFPTCTRFDLAVIIIAAINVTAALAMISYILFDARILARSLQVQRVFHIHPAEVFPLIISIAIIVQGTISIYVQSITFSLHLIKSLSPLNLQAIGQLAWSGKQSSPQ